MRKAVADKYRMDNLAREKIQEKRSQLGPAYVKDVTDDVFVTIDSSQLNDN